MTVWNESKPAMGDLLSELPSTLTTFMQAFQEGIDVAFLWESNSGSSAGQPLYSSASTKGGAFRAFFGPQSSVSTSKDGRLMVTSDTTRLYAVSNSTVVLLGSQAAVVGDATFYQSQNTIVPFTNVAGNTRWMMQSGFTGPFTTTADIGITPPIACGNKSVNITPFVNNAGTYGVSLAVVALGAGSVFTVRPAQLGSAVSFSFFWRVTGTMSVLTQV